MFCSLSGVAPDEPVVCVRSGHVYEKRLVMKHLETVGTEPVTGEEVTAADFIPIKSSKAVKPRPVAATSVGGLLSALQNEWDALMLETFQLRSTLESTRQELSQALYQHDAACRVIARLIKERDAARASLTAAQSSLAQRAAAAPSGGAASAADDAEMSGTGGAGEEAPTGLTSAIVANIINRNKELVKGRKKRVIAPETPAAAAVAASQRAASYTPHAASTPGITCIDVLTRVPAGTHVVTGGVDKTALVFDTAGGRVVSRLTGHSKRVSAVAAHPDRDAILTASYDGSMKVWVPTSGSGADAEYGCAVTLKAHSKEVTGLSLHPLGSLAVTGGRDGAWALHDIDAGRVVQVFNAADAVVPYDSMRLHPDGLLVATGGADGAIRVFDLRVQALAATFEGHTGSVGSLSFSENGFHMASGSADGSVKVWDLRKLEVIKTLAPPAAAADAAAAPAAATAVAFDLSGHYLAAGTASGVVACWDVPGGFSPLLSLQDHNAAVTGLAFAQHAHSLFTVSMDRGLHVYKN